jgi:hypothetical protein
VIRGNHTRLDYFARTGSLYGADEIVSMNLETAEELERAGFELDPDEHDARTMARWGTCTVEG